MKTISRFIRACFLFVIVVFSLVMMKAMSVFMLIKLNNKEDKNMLQTNYELAGYEV